MAKFSWRRAFEIFLAEFFGTATLLLVGCGGIAYGLMNNFAITPLMLAAINFGMAIAFTLSTFGCISQSHINPIMTVVTVVLGFIPIIYYPVYFAGQVLGGIFGMGLLRAVGVEATISFILCLLFCSVLDDRNKALHESIPIKFAITIASLAMSFGHYTGASMNPARSFGPAVVNNFWKDQWVYWVGPYAGSILASVFWRFVFFVKPPPPEPVEKD